MTIEWIGSNLAVSATPGMALARPTSAGEPSPARPSSDAAGQAGRSEVDIVHLDLWTRTLLALVSLELG
jgi:hypothetical protein